VEKGISLLIHENGLVEPLLTLYGPNIESFLFFSDIPLSRADAFLRLVSNIHLYDVSAFIRQEQLDPSVLLNVNQPLSNSDLQYNSVSYSGLSLPLYKTISKKGLDEVIPINTEDELVRYTSVLIEMKHSYRAFLISLKMFRKKIISLNTFMKCGLTALRSEYEYWIEQGLPFFALHALQDIQYYFPDVINKKEKKSIHDLKESLNINTKKHV